MRKIKKYSNHHIVPKSIGGNKTKDNMIRLSESKHRAIHTIFENKSTIAKIEYILEMDLQVLQGDFIRDIQQILNLYKGEIYHKHCIKK